MNQHAVKAAYKAAEGAVITGSLCDVTESSPKGSLLVGQGSEMAVFVGEAA
jgi:hypothetical protein